MAVTDSAVSPPATTKEADQSQSASTSTKAVKQPPIKIVIRRLPYTMTGEELLEQLAPIPEYEFFYFAKADALMLPWAYSRAYFGFRKESDVLTFRDRFNGYVFVDSKGTESMALVELAPNPKVPKLSLERAKNADNKCGTIEDDVDYKKFLSERENPEPIQIVSLEQRLKEVEEKAKSKKENMVQETPLVQFLLQKKEDKWRKQLDKRRQREDERKRRLAERAEQERREREQRKKDKEKESNKEKNKEKEQKPASSAASTERKKPEHQVAPRFAKSKPPTATAYRDDFDPVESAPVSAAKSRPKPTEKSTKPPRFEREDARKAAAAAEGKPTKPSRQDDGAPRRSKARPEREIYQPGQRKRAGADPVKKTEKTDDGHE